MYGGNTMDNDFTTLLRTYRKTMGWTQEVLSQKWSYSFETISAWERGKRTPNNHEVPRIAKFLEMRPEELATIITNSRIQPLKRSTKKQTNWQANFETWGELQQIYRNRVQFNRDFSYASMFADAQSIIAVGIGLNAIAQNYSKDDLTNTIIEKDCKVQLCFLDPRGDKCASREIEENHSPNYIADMTSANIISMQAIKRRIGRDNPLHANNLELRAYNLTPRFNIYVVDDTLMTVQHYGYGRGGDTPTLLLRREMQGGLFDFYASAVKYIVEHSTMIDETFRSLV
jgi:transcriptional regulator with XRE-family HTH domain